MKIDIQNIVRSPYFIGAVLGGAIALVGPVWFSPYLPFFQLSGYIFSLASLSQFSAAIEILNYEIVIPSFIIGWLIFKKLRLARPALSAAAVVIGIQAVTDLLRTVFPLSIVREIVKQGIWVETLIYALVGLLFAPLALRLVSRVQNKAQLAIAIALLVLVPVVVVSGLWRLRLGY